MWQAKNLAMRWEIQKKVIIDPQFAMKPASQPAYGWPALGDKIKSYLKEQGFRKLFADKNLRSESFENCLFHFWKCHCSSLGSYQLTACLSLEPAVCF